MLSGRSFHPALNQAAGTDIVGHDVAFFREHFVADTALVVLRVQLCERISTFEISRGVMFFAFT